MSMALTPLRSSWIRAAGYDGSTLRVVLKNGRVYDCPQVPRSIFNGLLVAAATGSAGGYFNRHIRGRFR